MDYRDPQIYPYYKKIEDDISALSYGDLLLTLAKCDEMLGFEIPEQYRDDALAYIFFIKEELHYLKIATSKENKRPCVNFEPQGKKENKNDTV